MTVLIQLFPMAKTVWTEAVVHEMHPALLDAVRGFNLAHRVFKRCSPHPEVLDLVTVTGARSEIMDQKVLRSLQTHV